MSIAAQLARLPHFRELPPALLERIAACCSRREHAARDVLFLEGSPCEAFYVVLEGAVRVHRSGPDGREQVLHHIGPGRTFAEAALFHHRVFPASATAEVTPTVVLRVDGSRFRELLLSEPELAPSMIGALCGWLHALVDRIELLTTVSAGARLAQYLLRLPAHRQQDRLVVELPVAKKTLAAELSITPETLSRLLARWKKLGLASSVGAVVELHDVRALEAVAGGD